MKSRKQAILDVLFGVNWIKTIRFNLHYFKPSVAMRFPAFIYKRTVMKRMDGEIILQGRIHTGMLRIGMPVVGIQDHYYTRTVWQMGGGVLIINELANFGRGTRLCLSNNAKLSLGKNFIANGEMDLICRKEISFGDECLLSWGLLIMDTDFHKITPIGDKEKISNPDRPITIGDHVWIGCRSTILKGASIPSGSIVAANSTITKKYDVNNAVYGGQGQEVRVLKEQIEWHM